MMPESPTLFELPATPPVACSDLLSVRLGRHTVLSECRKYRYTLWREWRLPHGLPYPLPLHTASEFVMFIGLNPSTADETKDDPTIRKCVGFAKRWGYGALCMTNLFAFRATQPKDMMAQERAVGPDNIAWLRKCAEQASLVVAAWGTKGSFRHQDRVVENYLKHLAHKPLKCLRKTKDGYPEHPLYVPYEKAVESYEARTDNEPS